MHNHPEAWHELPYPELAGSLGALHLWCQIVGKYRLSHSPWWNHSWHATLYVTPYGLRSGLVPDNFRNIEVHFDLHHHELRAVSSRGGAHSFALAPMSVAEFAEEFRNAIASLGGSPVFHGRPNEVPDPIPFDLDSQTRPYDREGIANFHASLLKIANVFEMFKTSFTGKCSPVHLFWGAFDLAVTRFSGRKAPLHPGGIPFLPDDVTREAYSDEVFSTGFWPGGYGVNEAMFYAYLYPNREAFREASIDNARFDSALGEFLLPYDRVRMADNPEVLLLKFLNESYEAAAVAGKWNRSELECAQGQPGIPRKVHSGPAPGG